MVRSGCGMGKSGASEFRGDDKMKSIKTYQQFESHVRSLGWIGEIKTHVNGGVYALFTKEIRFDHDKYGTISIEHETCFNGSDEWVHLDLLEQSNVLFSREVRELTGLLNEAAALAETLDNVCKMQRKV